MGRPRTWTDDDLRTAVTASQTYTEVMRRLGLAKGGGSRTAVYRRVAELALDDRHLREPTAGSTRSWTDDDLRSAVASATSLKGVFDELGLAVGGSQWLTVRDHLDRLGLDTSHWKRQGASVAARFDDDQLRVAVADSRSLAAVMRRLDIDVTGSAYRVLKAHINELGLDTSHMTGQGWNRGGTNPVSRRFARPLSDILVENSDYYDTNRLKRRLIHERLLAPECASCRLTRWNGQPAPLHLDHVNGDRRDNRLENLRLLCANCHAQTETYCGRNRGRYRRAREDGA